MTTLDGGVIIKKGTAPAPPSGGDNLIYINMEGYSNYVYPALFATLVKVKMGGYTQIIPNIYYQMTNASVAPIAIAVNIGEIYYMQNADGVMAETRYEDIMSGFAATDVLSLPRITKEEFYTLD